MTDVEAWKEHNEPFQYDGPDGPPESWSQDDYTELHDRLIGRRVEWYCQECSKPFNRLEKARYHVANTHGEDLYQKYGESDD